MKAMKNILVILALLMFPFATMVAQFASSSSGQQAQYTQYEFRTTSALPGSGSALPNASQNGVMLSGDRPGDNVPAYAPGGGPRRIGGSGSGTGGNEAEENDDPQETPLGDGLWAMMVLAAAYAGFVAYRRRKVVKG